MGFNCRKENKFGFPYLLMSALSGRMLDEHFALPEQHKPKVASQLARYWYELSQVRFDQIGRIWGGPGADDDLRSQHHHAVSLSPFLVIDSKPSPTPSECAYYYHEPRLILILLSARSINSHIKAQFIFSALDFTRPCTKVFSIYWRLIMLAESLQGKVADFKMP